MKEISWDELIDENYEEIEKVKRELIKEAVFNPHLWFTLMIDKWGEVYYGTATQQDNMSIDVFNEIATIIDQYNFKYEDWSNWAEEDFETFMTKWLTKHNRKDVIEEAKADDKSLYDYLAETLSNDYEYQCKLDYLKSEWGIDLEEE